MSENLSGQQKAALNLQRFREWINERDTAGDWTDYWRGDKLSRTDVAEECGFGKSALQQNPALKAELSALEERLRVEMAFGTTHLGKTAQDGSNQATDANSDKAVASRLARAKASADQRVKNLEEENAALRAEVAALRENQKKLQHLDAHLAETGRMVHP